MTLLFSKAIIINNMDYDFGQQIANTIDTRINQLMENGVLQLTEETERINTYVLSGPSVKPGVVQIFVFDGYGKLNQHYSSVMPVFNIGH